MSIRGKILFWFLLPIILIGIITAGTVYYSIRKTVEQNIFDQLIIASDELQERVRIYLLGKKGRNIDFSSDGFIRDCTEEIAEKESRWEYYINRLNTHLIVNKKSLDPGILEIFIVDFEGKVIASTEESRIGEDVSGAEYLSEAKPLSAFVDGPHYDDCFEEIIIDFSTVLLSKVERGPIGVIVNRIRTKAWEDKTLEGKSVYQDSEWNYSLLTAVNKARIMDFSSDGFIRDCTEEITKREDRIKYYSDSLNKHLITNKQPLDPGILEVFIVSLDGKVISSTETSLLGNDVSGEVYFSETMRRGSFISDLHYSPEFKQNTIEVARLLFSREEHKLIGMIFNRYKGDSFRRITHSGFSEEFRELMLEEGLGKTGELYIVNKDKLMITESRFIKNAILKQVVETTGVQNTLDNRTGMIGLYTNYRGVSVLGVSRYFEEMEWVILAEKDVSEAFAPIRNLRNITIIIGAIGIMFIITIAIFLARGITKPIQKLIEGTKRIAGGDLERPITISKSKDELKGLAESFNLMMNKLRESKEKNDQLFLEVKRGRDEWQKTFDAITDGLSIHGSDHAVRKLNLALQDMLNMTHEQAVTKKCNELIYGRERPLDICPFNKKGKNIRADSMEVSIDRVGKTFLVSTYPIFASCGKLIGCVHSMKDITEQKKSEEYVRKYSRDLEKKNQELIEMHKNVERQKKALQRLSERTVLIQEEERKNLSRELHDHTGQALVALKTNLEIIDKLLPEYAHEARHRLIKSEQLLLKTMEEMRSLSFFLRPPMLDDLGLVPTIKSYSRDFSTRTKIDVAVKSNLMGENLRSNLALFLYRMVQEALTNVAKHSEAKTVQINVYHENSNLVLSIKDDGKGFDIEKISQYGVLEHGLGLLGMKERFASIGAELQILSKEGEGTKLIARCQVD